MKLSPAQIKFMRGIRARRIGPFCQDDARIRRPLMRRGLIESHVSEYFTHSYRLTEAGNAALDEAIAAAKTNAS